MKQVQSNLPIVVTQGPELEGHVMHISRNDLLDPSILN